MKKQLKRGLCVFCGLVMVFGGFTGCNKKEDIAPIETPVTTEPTKKLEPTVQPAEAVQAKQDTVPAIDGYTLLWSDEFNEESLNTDIWNYDPHEPGWTNSELYDFNVQKPVTEFVEPEAGANYLNNGDFSNAEDLTDETD